jgi:hypothetical protein
LELTGSRFHERQTDDDEFVTIDTDDQQQRDEKPDRSSRATA